MPRLRGYDMHFREAGGRALVWEDPPWRALGIRLCDDFGRLGWRRGSCYSR